MAQENLPQIVNHAVAVSKKFPKEFANSIVLARTLAGLMVPALKQVTGYNQQPRVYTHQTAFADAAPTVGEIFTRTVNFTANADYLWTWLNITNGANGQAAHTYDLQVTFGGNDRNLVNRNAGIHAEAIAGAEREGWMLPKAFFVRKNTVLNILLTATAVTAIVNAFVWFGGIDYYDANVIDATRRSY